MLKALNPTSIGGKSRGAQKVVSSCNYKIESKPQPLSKSYGLSIPRVKNYFVELEEYPGLTPLGVPHLWSLKMSDVNTMPGSEAVFAKRLPEFVGLSPEKS
jgi:hypothetical protein